MDHHTLTKVLRASKLVPSGKIRALTAEAAAKNIPLEQLLTLSKTTTEEVLYQAAAKALKLEYLDLRNQTIRKELLNLVPETIASNHRMIPVEKRDGALLLATTEPNDVQTVEFIRRKAGIPVRLALCTPSSLGEALKSYHHALKAEFEQFSEATSKSATEKELKELAQNLPVVRIVDSILEYAAYESASDIHIEPTGQETVVRYRVDGILRNAMTLPRVVQDGIVARIKILANLKVDEHRLPQDGRFKVTMPEYKFSMRVSILPVYDGEKIVMRLLPETAQALSLEQLGLQPGAKTAVERAIKRPHGILYSTGPTGSGKTTTLYSLISILNKPGVNIVTVEDPIEYRISGVNQSQVQPRIGYTFANGLRSILRQDPNIIMVGEIRDQETAEIAANSAMTGHLVLSTLHTNDAPTAIPRLMDLGVPPFLIAFTTNAIIAQRLVRKVCKDCATADTVKTTELNQLADMVNVKDLTARLHVLKALPASATLTKMPVRRGAGCNKCGHEGYKGRIGIYELLEVTPAMAELIASKASVEAIRKQATADGMTSMFEDGMIKVLLGITTLAEILRVAKE